MFSKGSVLVVDDEINLCRILGAKLAKSGYSVVAVHDGQQAIDKVRETEFDVVLLDLILPKVDGLSALAQIRTFNHDLPVIVMTACGSSDTIERARSHGVSAYINKPFDLDSLVELVRVTSSGAGRKDDKCLANGSILFVRNQPIMLEVLNGRTSGLFQTTIDSKDERSLSVVAPTKDGATVQVVPRTPVRVGLGANDAYYSFNSYALALREGEPSVLVLDKPGVIYRSQRRQSPRLKGEMDVRYAKVADEDSKPEALALARSCDMSSGGIKIIATEKLGPGDMVYLETGVIGRIGPVTGVAEVLRSTEVEPDAKYIVAMRLKKIKGNLGRLLVD